MLREDISVTIIQSRSHILNTFDEQISEYAERRFEREGINIVTNARVVSIDKDKIRYRLKGLEGSEGGEPEIKEIPYGVCLWSTGIGSYILITMKRDSLHLALRNSNDSICKELG